MAEAAVTAANGGADGGERHDLKSILSSDGRDFLVRSNGDQVNINNLAGKVVGLYFSASWCGPCHRFTPKLADAYTELSSKGAPFEVVFVSADEDEDSFSKYFSEMPWLAIPFSDSETRDRLDKLFSVQGIPHLVILDESGKVVNEKAVQAVIEYGSESYPFTQERIAKMKADEEAAKKEQTLQSVLVSPSRDFLISNDGSKVPVLQLEGKIVGLYFCVSSYVPCNKFTPKLAAVHKELKEKGEGFEVVLVSLDSEESSFKTGFADMPWLAIPFKDKSRDRLVRYFELETIPTLVVIGSDGKTLMSNAAELVEDHGVEAYPFSQEKLAELAEKERARLEAQTLESLLVSGEKDYVIGKGGAKVQISELVGKNVLLYFSAQWCPPCRAFLPKLIDAYHQIKSRDANFEVIFISSDRDQASFDDFFSTMPWLALPFGDDRKGSLSRTFKISGIPSLVAIGPTGRTVTKEARNLMMVHGADAYPFTEERVRELEAAAEEEAKKWPERVKHPLHEEHELVRARRRGYTCDGCGEGGSGWSFYCKECDFDLHPKCALAEEEAEAAGDGEGGGEEEKSGKDGYVCDGEVCYKA
ncbi:putative nucleoredoxin 1 [Iris pallida]|uniref:protein-disulfide reductase n=1 Tax=Iris pallida TaxID=29817 RepID=A0AAX6HE39_IRIPA|nr:putative nucleoredoxin 1 [Iris pallida]